VFERDRVAPREDDDREEAALEDLLDDERLDDDRFEEDRLDDDRDGVALRVGVERADELDPDDRDRAELEELDDFEGLAELDLFEELFDLRSGASPSIPIETTTDDPWIAPRSPANPPLAAIPTIPTHNSMI
jgi:hypothetical protein